MMKSNVIDIYNDYGVSDTSIKHLLDEEHPSSYLPFVQKYITTELYKNNTTDVSRWLNMLYENAISFDDIMQEDLAEFYRHALTISNFEFQYAKPTYLNIHHILKIEDSTEFKRKLINYNKPDPGLLYMVTEGWPNLNEIKLQLEDVSIIKEHYATLVSEFLKAPALYQPNGLEYFCGSHGLMNTLLHAYMNYPIELHKIQKTSLQVLAHSHINESDYPTAYKIGRELYGDRFDHIYNIGKSLDLLGNPDFWTANELEIYSCELPQLLGDEYGAMS